MVAATHNHTNGSKSGDIDSLILKQEYHAEEEGGNRDLE
jgi:hypothetical protein